jgi:ABC-2 type transport system ATP-binding protein
MEEQPNQPDGFVTRARDILQAVAQQKVQAHSIGDTIIDADAVRKTYGGNRFELGPVDLNIRSGHLIGLVGENGNGKTTLLRMLANDLSLSSGRISYHFRKEEDEYDLRSKLIYIPQRTPKWFGKVKDNLKLTATHYGISSKDNELWVLMMMIRFGLWKFRNHSWNELSSGYKMRFELARTFLRKPRLLLLDEPLANLDIVSQQLILEDLKMLGKRLQHPLAIVLSSQQLYEVEKVSDEVVFLKNGKPSSFNSLKEENNAKTMLVVEIEIENSRDDLVTALQTFKLREIKRLGSNYYLELEDVHVTEFMKVLATNNIRVRYFRDITQSTRRFFNA